MFSKLCLPYPYKELPNYMKNTFHYSNFDILHELKKAGPGEVKMEKPQTIAHQQLLLLPDWYKQEKMKGY